MIKQRNINIEIVHILAMFMIILGHGHAGESIQSTMGVSYNRN